MELPEHIKQKVEELVKELAKQSTAPDKETPDWMECDIRRGLVHGYSLNNEEFEDYKLWANQQIKERDAEIERLKKANELLYKVSQERDGEIDVLKARIAEIVYLSEQPGGYHP